MRRLSGWLVVLGLVAALPVLAQDRSSFVLGTSVPAAQGQRTIVIGTDTKWVNVDRDEAIRFSFGNAEFGWKFDGTGDRPINLQLIAPQGVLPAPVMVYIKSRQHRP